MPARGEDLVQVIKDRLYFAYYSKAPTPEDGVHYFSTDRSLLYWNFFLDFGPMNIGQTYRFCELVDEKLKRIPNGRIVYYASNNGQRKANSIMLMCCYCMLKLSMTAEEAFMPFSHIKVPAFHDATPGHCTYDLSIMNCLKGLEKALKLGLFDYDSFDPDEYEHFEKVESGDLSWIFPKFVAFAGPHESKSYNEQYPTCEPEDYVDYFLKRKVTLVIRLNKKYYNEERFKMYGINHVDLYYPDGSCPKEEILDRFLQICEAHPKDEAIAVHCKAGLGRTGTCIGAYAMKHWGFTAAEVIGWMRLARPGSVIGPQQQYMENIQERMHRLGMESNVQTPQSRRTRSLVSAAIIPMETADSFSAEEVDRSQGDFLLNAKVHSPASPLQARKSLLTMASDEAPTGSSTAGTFLRGVARKLYAHGKG